MNTVHFEGNLCRAPSVLYTQYGQVVTNITLASDEYVGNNKKETLYIDCLILGTEGEKIGNSYMIGRQYKVDGKLIPNVYIDKETGKKVYKMQLKVNYIEEGYIPKKYAEENAAKDAA